MFCDALVLREHSPLVYNARSIGTNGNDDKLGSEPPGICPEALVPELLQHHMNRGELTFCSSETLPPDFIIALTPWSAGAAPQCHCFRRNEP